MLIRLTVAVEEGSEKNALGDRFVRLALVAPDACVVGPRFNDGCALGGLPRRANARFHLVVPLLLLAEAFHGVRLARDEGWVVFLDGSATEARFPMIRVHATIITNIELVRWRVHGAIFSGGQGPSILDLLHLHGQKVLGPGE